MFNYQHNIPKQHYRVETYPHVPELLQYIEQAQKIKGIKHCFYWVDEKTKTQFTLSIHVKAQGLEMEWWMHESNDLGQRMLWFYRTNDLSIIYPQVLQAVGAPDITKGEEEVEEATNNLLETLGGVRFGTPGSKYATPGSTLASQQAAAANKPPVAKLLSGNLQSLPMSSLLPVANKEAATGRLLVESEEGEAVVHFVHGRPVHCTTPSQQGLEALLELCTWQQGKITFTQGTKPDATTIQQSVEQILYLAAQLIESIGFLQEHQIDDMAVLKRTTDAISEQAFEKRILDGPPLGLDLQKRFFQHLDGNRTLKDIATLLSLSASQWIAISCNLLKLGLVLTPDGKCVIYDPSQDFKPTQATTGSFFLSGVDKQPGPSERFGRSQEHQSMLNDVQMAGGWSPQNSNQQSQATSGQFQKQATSGQFQQQATSGQFQQQATSGQFPAPNSGGGWNNQQAAPQGGSPQLMPPSGFFGSGGAGQSSDRPPSPAVEAFMSATTTVQDVDTVHVGLQTTEVTFNKATPKVVLSALCDPDTKILSFEAFQFFLDREFARAFRYSTGFTLIVFCMKLRASGKPSMPASKVVSLTCGAISKIKHDVDIFGHFGEKSYGLILPSCNSGQAASLVDKITTNIAKFAPELAQTRPTLYVGIASVPDDARDVDQLVANAQKAMQDAIKRNITRVLYSDLGK